MSGVRILLLPFLLALLPLAGCRIYGYARDLGVSECDHYDANRGGTAAVRDVSSETRIREEKPDGALYGVAMELHIVAGPSAAEREGARTLAYAKGHREFSFVPEVDGEHVLTVDVEREARRVEQGAADATLRWSATIVDDRSGRIVANLFNDPDRPAPGRLEARSALATGAPHRLVVHASMKADPTRVQAPGGDAPTAPRAEAETVLRVALHAPR